MHRLQQLFTAAIGHEADTIEPITAAGSNRRYYRLHSVSQPPAADVSLIGCIGTSREENDAFVYLARHMESHGLPVPHVVAVSDDGMCYLQSDLGSTSLFDAVRPGREAGGCYSPREEALLARAMSDLPRLQLLTVCGLDDSHCYPQPRMDEQTVLFDLQYFKYCFLKPTGIDFHELRLEQDFHALAASLLRPMALPEVFIIRDFQARNIMLTPVDGVPGSSAPFHLTYIDFQGGRRGPLFYDLASFLWQASARYGDDLRQRLMQSYLDNLPAAMQAADITPTAAMLAELQPEAFGRRLQEFALFRMLQVLGAYGFRGYVERKPHFLASIPPALESLRRLLPLVQLPPTLADVLARLVETQATPSGKPTGTLPDASALEVEVISFSYKRGLPVDTSGNGGGYIFDCRASNNPGRYPEYRSLTGLDRPVRDFIETDGELLRFLDYVRPIIDAHVRRFIQRGFTHLQVAFGCTGGQHRSVYSADHTAHRLARDFGVRVHLIHRELGIDEIITS